MVLAPRVVGWDLFDIDADIAECSPLAAHRLIEHIISVVRLLTQRPKLVRA